MFIGEKVKQNKIEIKRLMKSKKYERKKIINLFMRSKHFLKVVLYYCSKAQKKIITLKQANKFNSKYKSPKKKLRKELNWFA